MKVKVNDVELELSPGTSAIDAVFAAGYDVPFFCSQEYMSPIGACRMCLARVGAPRKDRATGEWILDEDTGLPKIFYFPNMMATCTTAVMEGMVIDTLSEEVKGAQNGMMEFTLINHPLDCPVCDKGGACELQDRAYEYGRGVSRFQFDKRHQEKHHVLSDLITLDRERCIHCKRCVRYFEEIPGDEVLDFIERGGHTYIGTADENLPSNFTGNITDICPVGALLDATSRFRGRNWEYDHTRSTGMDDPSGSAITIDARTGRIERIKAARNTRVNTDWIDDGTRFGHEYVDAPERLKTPLIRRGGRHVPATWEEAGAVIAEKLKALDSGEVGVVIRADATLEEAVAAKSLASELGSGRLDHAPRPAASVIPEGPVASLTDLATSDAILVIGDLSEEAPILDLRIKDALKGVEPAALLPHGVPIADLRLKERMPRKTEILAVAAPYEVDLMKHAGLSLRYEAAGEETLLRGLEKLLGGGSPDEAVAQGWGASKERLNGFIETFKQAENPVIVYGSFVLASGAASRAVADLAKAAGAKSLAVGPMANSFGLEQVEVLPSHNRYRYEAMLAGDAKALILSMLDPARNETLVERLKALDFLVVHDLFMSATAELADVVLPAKSGYEKEGTVVNVEGRYLSVRPAPVDGGLSEDFTGVVKVLGEALGTRLEGRSVRAARRALKKTLEVDLWELPEEGLLPQLKAKSVVKAPEAERAGELLLIRTMVRHEYLDKNPRLRAAKGDTALYLHPEDLGALGLEAGSIVSLPVAGFKRRAVLRPTTRVPRGLSLLPALPDQPAGLVAVDLSQAEVERSALEVVA